MRNVLAVLALLAAGRAAAESRPPAAAEHEVKAAFVFNFAKFVEWPAGTFAGPDTPVLIGVLGECPPGEAIEDAVRGKTIDGRPLEVRRSSQFEELRMSQILFVCRSEARRLGEILGAVAPGTLTIGDTEGFAERGGIINLTVEDAKVRFEINEQAAHAAGIRISSQLLKLARVVGRP